MDKMFYTLEEAAQRLGKSQDQIQAMVSGGQLDQLRDGNKIMFKRDQVDQLASGDSGDAMSLSDDSGIGLADSGIGLADTGRSDATDAIPLSLDEASNTGSTDAADIMGITDTGLSATGSGIGLTGTNELDLDDPADGTGIELSATGLGLTGTGTGFDIDLNDTGTNIESDDLKSQTGISVFDAGEIDHADPMAQTQVSSPNIDEDMLALDSVGSGSGLLDLTRESDDTSLGAELLDEIYPAGEGSDAKLEDLPGSSAVFETGTGTALTDTGVSSGFADIDVASVDEAGESATGMTAIGAGYSEAMDPAGAGLVAGMLIGSFIALLLVLIVTVSALGGAASSVTETLSQSNGMLWGAAGGLLVVSIVLGVLFMFVGKAVDR